MSDWASIVARVKNRMETVADVGIVYDERRLITDEPSFGSVLVTDIGGERRARAWMVTHEDVDTRWVTHDGIVDWDRRALLHGFFQFEDAQSTGNTAVAIAEAVCAAIDSDLAATRLNGTVSSGGPCRIVRNEPRVMAFVLCHYVEIEVPLKTVEQR